MLPEDWLQPEKVTHFVLNRMMMDNDTSRIDEWQEAGAPVDVSDMLRRKSLASTSFCLSACPFNLASQCYRIFKGQLFHDKMLLGQEDSLSQYPYLRTVSMTCPFFMVVSSSGISRLTKRLIKKPLLWDWIRLYWLPVKSTLVVLG